MNKEKPVVSVCIITYKHEKYIKECIEGAIMQETNFNFEIIIGDDYSPDLTSKICKEYALKYPDLINYEKNDKNIGMARNWMKTINRCSGKYIAICEGDDYWTDPLKLQKQVDFMEANQEYSMCFHEAEVIDENNNFLHYFNKIKLEKTYSLSDLTQRNFVSTASCLFKNEIVLHNSFAKLSVGDWALHILNAEKGKIFYMPISMSVYRVHDGGIWSKLNYNEMILKGVEVMKDLDSFFEYRYHEDFQRGINDRLLRLRKNKKPKTIKKKIVLRIRNILSKYKIN